jgi:iron complex transport system ATP-binding protein
VLAAHHVSFALAGRWLLREVSVTVKPGEVLAVIGPNGAGKSTLLKVLCGDITPNVGEVTLDGQPLALWSNLEQAKRRALLSQSASLSFPFRVLEVVLMGRNPHVKGRESARDYAVAEAALAQVAMCDFVQREYPTLSGGEQQRVQLARTLAQVWEVAQTDNRYLLLDEPTNNLDLSHQHQTLHVARRFAREGAGVLAVLHDLNLAAQYADRVVILCQGRVHALGTPQEVFTSETLCDAFKTPVMVTRHPCLDCPLVVSAQLPTDAPEGRGMMQRG